MVGSGETQRRGERQIQDHRGRVESEPQREMERRGMEGSLQTLKGQSIFTYSPPKKNPPFSPVSSFLTNSGPSSQACFLFLSEGLHPWLCF